MNSGKMYTLALLTVFALQSHAAISNSDSLTNRIKSKVNKTAQYTKKTLASIDPKKAAIIASASAMGFCAAALLWYTSSTAKSLLSSSYNFIAAPAVIAMDVAKAKYALLKNAVLKVASKKIKAPLTEKVVVQEKPVVATTQRVRRHSAYLSRDVTPSNALNEVTA